MRIAVAGGTGLIGRMVVSAAQAAGHDTVVLSRARGVDLTLGRGIDDALKGADAVIDVSNVATSTAKKSVAFFGTATPALLKAESAARVKHHVALSIVGIDRVAFGYYAGKVEQERLVAEGRVPWTILRATQFHEFAVQLLARVPGPVAIVPRMRSATVAAGEVASHLVRLASDGPGGHVPEMAGPEVLDMPHLVRRVVAARKQRRLVLPVRLPGATGRAMAGDGLLPQWTDVVRGELTFDAWLAASV